MIKRVMALIASCCLAWVMAVMQQYPSSVVASITGWDLILDALFVSGFS